MMEILIAIFFVLLIQMVIRVIGENIITRMKMVNSSFSTLRTMKKLVIGGLRKMYCIVLIIINHHKMLYIKIVFVEIRFI